MLASRCAADVDLGAFENVEGAAVPISAGAFGNNDADDSFDDFDNDDFGNADLLDDDEEDKEGNNGASNAEEGQNVQEGAINEENKRPAGASVGDTGAGSTDLGAGTLPSTNTTDASNASESGQPPIATDAAVTDERRKRKRKAKRKKQKTKLKIRCATRRENLTHVASSCIDSFRHLLLAVLFCFWHVVFFVCSYERFQQITRMLVHMIRDETGGEGALKQKDLITRYLKQATDAGRVDSEETLRQENRIVRQVIERLIAVDQILLAEDPLPGAGGAGSGSDEQAENEPTGGDAKRKRLKKKEKRQKSASKAERTITVHPNYSAAE